MTEIDRNFSGSIAALDERLLVPLIFEPYAQDLAQRVAAMKPRAVLETAAGTGVVTRVMAALLPQTRIVATDLNPAMLNQACALAGGATQIEWREADALALPFADNAFDVVACQFGAMFFPDKVHGYREARRVLKPGGRFLFNVWDRIEANDFADCVIEALAAVFPHDPPRFLARTPHGYHDVDRIRAELAAAGFADISIEAVDEISKATSPLDPAIAYCQGTPLRNEIEARDPSRLEAATQSAAEALARRFGTGAIAGRIRAFVITAITG